MSGEMAGGFVLVGDRGVARGSRAVPPQELQGQSPLGAESDTFCPGENGEGV
jgi:hypothetical protein